MSEFPNCLLVVTAEIDPAVEDEWNTWYNDVHLPDALACPGVIGGRRYVSARDVAVTENGEKKTLSNKVYTTVYAIEGPEVLDTPEFNAMRGWYHFSEKIKARTVVVEGI